MGAFKIEVMLHDAELERFIQQALADELSPEARYVAERMCDEVPELRPERRGLQ
jgi:hypothetical protein